MKKYLLTFLLMFGVSISGVASATLWDYYSQKGQTLPSLEERSLLYSEVASDKYTGSSEQNNLLENFILESEKPLGAVLPVAGVTYTLAGSGVTASASSITLQSLTIPQTGYELLDSDFSDTFYLTFEPGNTKRQELASCTTATQNANNTATLSGCSRGLLPFSPYTASTTYAFSHGGGTQVIFSDSPQLFNEYPAKSNAETITRVWTYDVHPTASSSLGVPTSTYQYVTKQYADNIANQGAATSSANNAGIVEEATVIEMASSTQFDANNPHYISSEYSTSTPTYSCNTSGVSGALCVPVAKNNGKLHQSWLDLTESYPWTGIHSWSSTSSVTFGGVTMNASSTANALPITMRNGELDFGFVSNVNVSVTTTGEVINGLTTPQAVAFSSTTGHYVLANASATSTANFVGFITRSLAQYQTPNVITNGIVRGFSGLTPGARYFVDTSNGAITKTYPNTDPQIVIPVGIALDSSTILVQKGGRIAAGSAPSLSGVDGTNDMVVAIGFKPSLVIIRGELNANGSNVGRCQVTANFVGTQARGITNVYQDGAGTALTSSNLHTFYLNNLQCDSTGANTNRITLSMQALDDNGFTLRATETNLGGGGGNGSWISGYYIAIE